MAKGFKSPKMQNPMSMMGSLQKLQEQIQQMQEQLADEEVTASAGGGVVEMLQDLVLTAVNNALDASRQLAADRMGPLTGGLGLPF
jgi:DNA-binding protein YbaB